jgi:WhiB family redox-sensing transcriptional regulator
MTAAAAVRDWRDLAACRDADPELFFDPERAAEAARSCAGCPVREACLDWALRHCQDFGVWGGVTEEKRRAARAAARAVPRAPVLCGAGRHLKNGPGRCQACAREYQRKREKTRVRDQSARAAARRAARPEKPRVRTKGLAA